MKVKKYENPYSRRTKIKRGKYKILLHIDDDIIKKIRQKNIINLTEFINNSLREYLDK